jgi:hypothetical protein
VSISRHCQPPRSGRSREGEGGVGRSSGTPAR